MSGVTGTRHAAHGDTPGGLCSAACTAYGRPVSTMLCVAESRSYTWQRPGGELSLRALQPGPAGQQVAVTTCCPASDEPPQEVALPVRLPLREGPSRRRRLHSPINPRGPFVAAETEGVPHRVGVHTPAVTAGARESCRKPAPSDRTRLCSASMSSTSKLMWNCFGCSLSGYTGGGTAQAAGNARSTSEKLMKAMPSELPSPTRRPSTPLWRAASLIGFERKSAGGGSRLNVATAAAQSPPRETSPHQAAGPPPRFRSGSSQSDRSLPTDRPVGRLGNPWPGRNPGRRSAARSWQRVSREAAHHGPAYVVRHLLPRGGSPVISKDLRAAMSPV